MKKLHKNQKQISQRDVVWVGEFNLLGFNYNLHAVKKKKNRKGGAIWKC